MKLNILISGLKKKIFSKKHQELKLKELMYYKKLDGLRFIAISMVMIEHFAYFIGSRFSFGYYGVDLFFVLSGFLITSILLRPNSASFYQNYKNFIGRRTIRIFPLYYFTLFLLYFLGNPDVQESFVWLLSYTYNYGHVVNNLTSNSISHFWSLSVEEQFYLFWPIIILLIRSNGKLLMFITICFIIVGYGQMQFNIFPSITKYNYTGLPTRMASLAMGALGAILIRFYGVPVRILNNKSIEFAMLLGLFCLLVTNFSFKYPLLGFCSLFFVLKSCYSEFKFRFINRFLENDKIVNIGIVCYGIYIFHKPIGYYFDIFIFNNIWAQIDFSVLGKFSVLEFHSWILKLPLYFTLSILLAKISFKYFESPILRLKDRFFKYD